MTSEAHFAAFVALIQYQEVKVTTYNTQTIYSLRDNYSNRKYLSVGFNEHGDCNWWDVIEYE